MKVTEVASMLEREFGIKYNEKNYAELRLPESSDTQLTFCYLYAAQDDEYYFIADLRTPSLKRNFCGDDLIVPAEGCSLLSVQNHIAFVKKKNPNYFV